MNFAMSHKFGISSFYRRLGTFMPFLFPTLLSAHGVADHEQVQLHEMNGRNFLIFIYLGAKHMLTGYDHLLFIFGVIFFLYRLRDVGIYLTLFAVGHSVTLLIGVLTKLEINENLINAITGISVVYKALDNLGAFQSWFGSRPNEKAAVLVFGFFHGLGLAASLQSFSLSPDSLIPNLLAFNIGIEIGQFLALGVLVIALSCWRQSSAFSRHSFVANTLLMSMGFLLIGYQATDYLAS